jgi:hypothetical protein
LTRPERLQLKRAAAQAHNDIERCLSNVKWLYDRFAPVHAEHAEMLETTAQALFVSRDLLLKFWTAAWGPPPDNFDSYRGE